MMNQKRGLTERGIYELNFNFTNIYFAYHKIMVYYIDFC